MESTREQAREQGFVETLFGRRLYLPDINARNQQIARAPNALQSMRRCRGPRRTSSSAMLAVDDWIESKQPPVRMLMQVHDELVFEVETGCDRIGRQKDPR